MLTHVKNRIESIINNINQLPSIPEVASHVLNMVNNPDIDFKQVAAEISKDQALTTNLLKLCNSAYFSKGKEISSLDRAIVTLGIKEVKDAVLVIATRTVLDKVVMGYDLTKGMLWQHGVAVAMMAKKIAMLTGEKARADIAFTGGLIHDVGKTVLALFVQNVFKDIMNAVENQSLSFHSAEKATMGSEHQAIGEKVVEKWKCPEILKDIVRFHHQPFESSETNRKMVSIVHIANSVCLMAGIGIGSDGLFHELSTEAIALTGLADVQLESLYSEIPELLNQTKDIV